MTYGIHINETFSTLIFVQVIYGVQPWNLIIVMFQRLMDNLKHLILTLLSRPKFQCLENLKTSLLVSPSLWSVGWSLHSSDSVRSFLILCLWYFTLHEATEVQNYFKVYLSQWIWSLCYWSVFDLCCAVLLVSNLGRESWKHASIPNWDLLVYRIHLK